MTSCIISPSHSEEQQQCHQQQQQQQQQQQLERNRSKLCILYHAATCPYQDDNYQYRNDSNNFSFSNCINTSKNAQSQHRPSSCCPMERRCCAAKRLLAHIHGCYCNNGNHCVVPGCKHSRAVWKHYRKCRYNTPQQHAACSICSVVPTPYNPASFCAQFLIPMSSSSSSLLPATAIATTTTASCYYAHHGGDSMAATRGSEHDQQEDGNFQQKQGFIDRPPRRIQSLPYPKSTTTTLFTPPTTTPSPPPPSTTTSTNTTTLAAKQAAAKLMGSILDDSTMVSTVVENSYQPSLESDKENDTNFTFHRPRDSTTTTPTTAATAAATRTTGCVMDTLGSFMSESRSTTMMVQPQQLLPTGRYHSTRSSMTPQSYTGTATATVTGGGGGGRKSNRYYQLEDSSTPTIHKWGGFLSLRRTTGRFKTEIAQQQQQQPQTPMVITDNSSLIMPTDEEEDDDEDEDSMVEYPNRKERKAAASSSISTGSEKRQEASLRRKQQRRFLSLQQQRN
jgi:hypothetical protein